MVISAEVAEWLRVAPTKDAAKAQTVLGLLEAKGNAIDRKHSQSLGDGLFELRFSVLDVARRITYHFAANQEIHVLTTFRKSRQNEEAEVHRARAAKVACEMEDATS